VVLFLDIKNAFNAVNHRAIFSLLEAYGFHKVDVDFSVECILGNSYLLLIHLVNQLRVFFGVVFFKVTHPARTSSTLPSTQHIRWCEPVGGDALLRVWMVHQDLVDLRMIPRFTQAAVMLSPLCAHWLIR
jgi:hypothetical protein